MRTSRVAKEAAKIVDRVPRTDVINQRQTRSFATSLRTFTANGTAIQKTEDLTVKKEPYHDDESSLSSLSSSLAFDIEDLPNPPSRKRNRGSDTTPTTVTKISTHTTTLSSPVKSGIAINDGKVKKARRQPARKLVNESGEVEIHPPSNWEQIYEFVSEMRKNVVAPVDTMGCETLAEEQISPRVSLIVFHLLGRLMNFRTSAFRP